MTESWTELEKIPIKAPKPAPAKKPEEKKPEEKKQEEKKEEAKEGEAATGGTEEQKNGE